MEKSTYSFLPWLRQGIASEINEEDSLGQGVDPSRNRATFTVDVTVKGIPVEGGADYEDAALVHKDIGLFGPGEVIGVDKRSIVRVEPLHGVTDFEPNYFPYVEFYDEDFPWRYSPAKAKNEKLRPWLLLLVLEESEFERKLLPDALLPIIAHGTKEIPFPDQTQTWAWAHVHVNKALRNGGGMPTGADAAGNLFTEVDSNPDIASSRLICPRKLKPYTGYYAFLVPAFEQGRLSGLGADEERISTVDVQQWSWDEHPGDEFAGMWPYYHEWYFRTGEPVDFEALVRRIEPRDLTKSPYSEMNIGKRPMDIQEPGYLLKYDGDDGTVKLEGALRLPEDEGDPYMQFGSEPEPRETFVEHLRDLLNLSEDLVDPTVPSNYYRNRDLFPDDGSAVDEETTPDPEDYSDDPVVTAPIYGQWYPTDPDEPKRVDFDLPSPTESQLNFWLNELNLDPRNRVPSSFGAEVIIRNQEKLMDRAWEQVGDILEALRKIRFGELSLELSKKLFEKYFEDLDPADFVNLTSMLHTRLLFSDLTIKSKIGLSELSGTVMKQEFLRFSRPNGPIFKRLNFGFGETMLGSFLNPVFAQPLDEAGGLQFGLKNFGKAYENVGGIDPTVVNLSNIVLNKGIALAGLDLEILFPGGLPFINLGLKSIVTPLPGPDKTVKAVFEGFTPYFEATNWDTAAELEPIDLAEVKTAVVEKIVPEKSIPRKIWSGINWTPPEPKGSVLLKPVPRGPLPLAQKKPDVIIPVMAYPKFPEPMYIDMKAISKELLLPGIDKIPEDTFTILETNQPFIESYMVGLNHEMARELLWREYPTDQRGSYFRQFWENIDSGKKQGEAFDIKEIHRWKYSQGLNLHDTSLGRNHPDDSGVPNDTGNSKKNRLVFVIRGELLKKYPNTVIYMLRAEWIGGIQGNGPRELADENVPSNIINPIFQAKVEPDITFLGFDTTVDEARGGGADPGWYFIIKERPGEPRFGMDFNSGSITDWDDLAWNHVPTTDGNHVDLDNYTGPNTLKINEDPEPEFADNAQLSWKKNAAHMAGILLQLPFMMAIHADEMLPD